MFRISAYKLHYTQVLVLYPIDSTELKCIIYTSIFSRSDYILGGLHAVQYRVLHYFLLNSILLGGGLKLPQALMTRRPWTQG